MKSWLIVLLIFVILFTIYLLGPKPPRPKFSNKLPKVPKDFGQLEDFIQNQEKQHPLRKDNQARIEFYEEDRTKTDFSLVYLHGFGGSYRDGYPVNHEIAQALKSNIYFNRMPGHGLEIPYSLDHFSAEEAWEEPKKALVIGNLIGKKTILISTSTGGTLATKLAAEFPEKIFALVNMSPNYEDDQNAAPILGSHWGYEIAKLITLGKDRKIKHKEKAAEQYWDSEYNSRALVDLQVLLDSTMTEQTFAKVKCPILTLYYSEHEFKEDDHVEIDKYPKVHRQFSTRKDLNLIKRLKTQETHFIGSDIKSKDTESVKAEILKFLNDKLNIRCQPNST